MNLQNITSIIAIMPLLCALVGTEVGPKSGWMHLISGITRTSKDVIMGTAGRLRQILPPGEITYPDDLVITELAEYLKDKMKQPQPSLEIPVLDPFVVEQLNFNITHEMIGQLSLCLDDINITKMSEFKVDKMKIKWLQRKLEFDLRFSEIHVRTKYNMKGVLGNVLPVHGNGPASVSAINVNFTGTVVLGTQNISLYMKNLDLNYYIEAFQVNMTNLMGGGRLSELLNTVLSQEGTQILELVRTDVTHIATSWFHSIGNNVLRKMNISFRDILDFIKTAGTKNIRKIFNLTPFRNEF